MNDNNDEHVNIEVVPEVTDSGDNHQYSNDLTPVNEVRKEQTTLSVIGLILALPFPILIMALWVMMTVIKQQNQALGEGAMNVVFLYLLQFFLVPLLSISSVIIACIVTIKSRRIAKRIGYISMGITGFGLILLGLFLNHP